jgi:uncharacterized membrane protein
MVSSVQTPNKNRVRANIWMLRFTRNWAKVVVIALGIYSLLPFAAPALMAAGAQSPARLLYTLYSPFCHQFAFRSVFLFGEQTMYPRAVSGTDLRPFEAYIQDSPEFQQSVEKVLVDRTGSVDPAVVAAFDPYEFTALLQFAARDFVGSPQMGYKMTLCARDAAIYVAMFIGGLVYLRPGIRRRLRPAPILLYALLGLGPMGIDGLSQLLGYPPFNLWPPRETEPIFRVVTGALFGLMNIWLGFPYLEASMRESRDRIQAKLAKAGIYV